MADVVEPEDFAVGGVKEGHAEAVEIEGAASDTAGVAFGLGEDVLGSEGDLLGLDDTEGLPGDAEGVVGGAVGRVKLGEGVGGVVGRWRGWVEGSNGPA